MREENNPKREMGKEEVLEIQPKTQQPEISFHALVGSQNPKTIRIMEQVRVQNVAVPIDSGSAHNFSDPSVIKKEKIPI